MERTGGKLQSGWTERGREKDREWEGEKEVGRRRENQCVYIKKKNSHEEQRQLSLPFFYSSSGKMEF